MSNQPLNLEALENYCRAFARKTADTFFTDQASITGREIISFCEIVQVNLFVLDKLFASWQREIARLQSPYFDYEAPEVKEGLEQFMNTLSRYIKVGRSHFEPLLVSAAMDTIHLSVAPYSFFEEMFGQVASQPISLQILKERLKFFRVNKFLFEEVVNHLEAQSIDEVSIDSLKIVFDGVYASQKDRLESIDTLIDLFSHYVPLKQTDLFYSPAPSKPKQPAPQLQQSFWVDIEQFANAASQPQVTKPATSVPKPVQTENTPEPPKILVTAPVTPVNLPPPVPSPVVEPTVVKIEPPKVELVPPIAKVESNPPSGQPPAPVKPSVTSLNDVLNQEKETLNDKFRTNANKTFVEKAAKQRINNLQAAIPLHQKFMFVKGLFKGDSNAFHQVLNEIEQCPDYKSAVRMLEDKYAQFYAWNPASEEVKTFLDLVERKYL